MAPKVSPPSRALHRRVAAFRAWTTLPTRNESVSSLPQFVVSVRVYVSIMCLCVFVRDTEGSRTPPCTMCVCVRVSEAIVQGHLISGLSVAILKGGVAEGVLHVQPCRNF